ncbi:PTS lactose/cellobiose transporter subunit IIA [Streptobacillus canis]|uniref:PTS lactose/cellobiose transporter subunit IIA n=1 Tax=Streptobacillus canis TaxID=2678686 RepID=UPI0012E2A7BB|nr:PTS lactose/cellobiose transporter subunit IIA [Streptobacillus canis]
MNEEKLEEIVFEIISNAGMAKGLIYEAMTESLNGNFDKVESLLKEADEFLLNAHKVQTDIIRQEADGEHLEVRVLFVHAQDHLMTTIEIRNLAETIIKMNEKINKLENK